MPLTSPMDITEVAIISDSAHRTTNCAIYDLKTESLLASFKEGHSVPRGLCFIGCDHLISAFDDKACLKVWKVSNKNLEEDKMTCSGKVLCLAVTNCGRYCAAGIGKAIHVWEVQSGDLLTILSHHSQNVTNLKFTTDGYYLISGGKDGLVLVWRLAQIISYTDIKPRFTWMHHAGEITDIYVGHSGQYARVATVSSDMTCKIYELDSGNTMTSISTDYSITAVTMDPTESFVILGSNDGNLYRINLWTVRDGESITSETKDGVLGHSDAITCLSISIFGKYLLSGSEDTYCKIWDVLSFTCLKKLEFEGRITNAFISLLPPGLRSEGNYETRLTVSKFKREYDQNSEDVTSRIRDRKLSLIHVGSPDEYFLPGILNYSEKGEYMSKSKVSLHSMETINRQLYAYSLSNSMGLIYDEDSSD